MSNSREESMGLRNRALRRQMDSLFRTICDTKTGIEAETAMGELWGSGLFDCGPQDYAYIVERCLVAIREYDESHTKPIPQYFGSESSFRS